jgi:hypothetical protein
VVPYILTFRFLEEERKIVLTKLNVLLNLTKVISAVDLNSAQNKNKY